MRWIFLPGMIIIASFLLAACAGGQPEGFTPVVAASLGGSATDPPPGAELQLTAGDLLTDEEATQILYDLAGGGPETRQTALARIRGSGDERFIPVLIELLRAEQIGLLPTSLGSQTVETLEFLSGQSFGSDWPDWVTWYGSQNLIPPPGFTGWKGQLLAAIDPGFAAFLQDDLPSRIRTEEIQWGGVLVDGIPALDNPAMIPAGQATYLEDGEPVFGISIQGDSRAYPLRIMDWHEMANDVVGGVPLSLAYCTLCGAGIAYDGRGPDGSVYTFGSSGFLYRSNKLMYDRQTRTLWNQLTGEPVLGVLAGGPEEERIRLDLLPVVLTTWADWREEHPDTLVLDIDTGFNRPYSPGAAYGDYFASDDTMFPVWQRSDLLETKARIYALQIGGVPKAYPLEILAEERLVNDTLGGTPIVLVAPRGVVRVAGEDSRSGPVTYEAGGEVRAFVRSDFTFSPGPDPDSLVDQQGGVWDVTEEALIGPNGESAPRLGGHLAYWFGWFTFFPNTLVYREE
jgi:Protein of unknown function (DUF3179)